MFRLGMSHESPELCGMWYVIIIQAQRRAVLWNGRGEDRLTFVMAFFEAEPRRGGAQLSARCCLIRAGGQRLCSSIKLLVQKD